MKTFKAGILIGVLTLSMGCATQAPAPPESGFRIPDSPMGERKAGPLPDAMWWKGFDSPDLDFWIERAFSENPGVDAAVARMEQARAGLGISGAFRTPSLSLSAETGHARNRSGVESATDRVRTGLSASYELDVWGRLAATQEGQRALFRATRHDLDALGMTLSAEVATAWVDWVASRDALVEVRAIEEEDVKLLRVQEERFSLGQATALDVLSQRDSVLEVRAAIPPIEAALEDAGIRLEVLAGLPPSGAVSVTGELPEVERAGTLAIPAAVLSNRPDVSAAGERLMAARWNTEAAKADRLPSFTLSASTAFSAAALSRLTQSWIVDLAAGLGLPLVDGGRRKQEVARSEAVDRERLAAYRSVVLTALREVAQALVVEEREQAVFVKTLQQLESARITQGEALRRYLRGGGEFDRYLSARRQVRSLERSRVTRHAAVVRARIALFRALGSDGDLERRIRLDGKDEKA